MSGLFNKDLITVLLVASALVAGNARGASPAHGQPVVCQTAVLRNGFTLQYIKQEVIGPTTRLWVCADSADGYVEFPTDQIERYEPGAGTVAPEPANGNPSGEDSIKGLIASVALRHQIDPDFVASVVKAESNFNPRAVSSKGAGGLMQLMPQTAADLGVENIFDPAANVEGGTKYLRQLLDQYDGDALKALAAYNAGPQRVDQYGGIPPYRETRAYVSRVINDYNGKKLEEQTDSRGGK